jgi:N-acetyl-gamma-glutamyl-phosphate reductase
MGSNVAHITARYDERTNTVIAICAIDNLAKEHRAEQCKRRTSRWALPETSGLSSVGLYP